MKIGTASLHYANEAFIGRSLITTLVCLRKRAAIQSQFKGISDALMRMLLFWDLPLNRSSNAKDQSGIC